jgi:hypothetical protein
MGQDLNKVQMSVSGFSGIANLSWVQKQKQKL